MAFKVMLLSCLVLVGCVDDTPVFVNCGNGYQVRPPLACPDVRVDFGHV